MSGIAPVPAINKTEGIFEELKEVQRRYEFIPAAEMKRIAERRGITLREVHAVASFYPHFYLKPPAKVMIKVCDDMSCHLRGSLALQRKLEQRFQGMNETELAIRNVSCVGRCDHAPALVINDRYYDGFTPDQAVEAVSQTIVGNPPEESHYRVREMQLMCDPYEGKRPYTALRELVHSRDTEGLLAKIKAAGLKGMGGAGYPTHLKWESVRKSTSPEKYIVCNADESEPGTIKDRFILTQLPHLVIEGMVLAGIALGAKHGYLYIRHEYQEQEHILKNELARCYAANLCGKKILGSELRFELTIFVSPGGYICGEETALLEAIEGKRSEPRNKPPFMASIGLWNKPTAINNVETLAFAAAIAAKGPEWFNSHQFNGFTGLKFVGVTGDVANPGIFEVPMGTTYRQLIEQHAGGIPGGRKLKGYAPSGPSSGYLPASMVDLPIDWQTLAKAGSMVGSGAVVVCAEDSCMLDMALNAVKFYRNESCGKCVPCRIGSQKMVEMLHGWTEGRFEDSQLGLLDELSHALKMTSICGLGQIIPAPIQTVMTHFKEEVYEHILNRRCPAGVCPMGATT